MINAGRNYGNGHHTNTEAYKGIRDKMWKYWYQNDVRVSIVDQKAYKKKRV